MASTPIGSRADPSGGGAAWVETTGTAEFSAAPTSRSVFFFTALFAFRPDAQDYTKARRGSCCITVCKLSIFCLIFVSEISWNRYNAPSPVAGSTAFVATVRMLLYGWGPPLQFPSAAHRPRSRYHLTFRFPEHARPVRRRLSGRRGAGISPTLRCSCFGFPDSGTRGRTPTCASGSR